MFLSILDYYPFLAHGLGTVWDCRTIAHSITYMFSMWTCPAEAYQKLLLLKTPSTIVCYCKASTLSSICSTKDSSIKAVDEFF
jgi:hypothetical protein